MLDLNECRGVGGDSLAYALPGLKHLEALNVTGLEEIQDYLVTDAAIALPLRELSLNR